MHKLVALLLAGSVVLNAALLALIVTGSRSSIDAPGRLAAGAPPLAPVPRPAGPVIDASVWPTLSGSGDLPALVASLREHGFPPAMVRAITLAQVQEILAARRRALDPEADSRPFWKSTLDPKVTDAQRQSFREQQKMLRELLGHDARADDPLSRAREKRMFGHLAPEKARAAQDIVNEFHDLRNDLFMSVAGGGPVMITASMREKMAALDQQMNAELAKLMTPREFEEFELRGSSTANNMRYQLASFDPTEAEFRTVFQLQRAFDLRFSNMIGSSSQEQTRLRTEAHSQLREQIKAALGPTRGEDYERSINYEYRTTSQLVARLELPPDTTNKLWSIRDETQKRARELHSTGSLTPEQRTDRLRALQQEAVNRIAPLLGGASRVDVYKQYGGQWLTSLLPRTSSPQPLIPARL